MDAAGKILDNIEAGVDEAGKGDSEIIKQVVDQLQENQKDHILQDKHNWNKLVPDPKDPNNWKSIAAFIIKVLSDGSESIYKYITGGEPIYIKTLDIDGEIVEVTYRIVDGIIKI